MAAYVLTNGYPCLVNAVALSYLSWVHAKVGRVSVN